MEKYSDPRKIIEWLEVLQHLPDATRTRQAAFAWIRVFCGRNNFSKRVRIMRKATFICARVLYESKIRLDHVCMRLWRQLWEGFNYMEFDINLWMDGSPQWRGLELFASVFDITSSDGMFYRRRRFPQLSLERHQLDAYSKVLAIVWQIFLIVGLHGFRSFCYRVVSICCDQGVERFVAGCRDIATSIFRFVGVRSIPGIPEHPTFANVFPRAILCAGWRHLWDTITSRGLSNTPFFTPWLKCFKRLIVFLRLETVRTEIERRLKQQGMNGLAFLVIDNLMQPFANWRWSTLGRNTLTAMNFMPSLRYHFDPAWFSNMRDKGLLADATFFFFEAIACNVFWSTFVGFQTGALLLCSGSEVVGVTSRSCMRVMT